MTGSFFSRRLLSLFLSPHNAGTADPCHASGEAVNPACNDMTVITLTVAHGRITQARFKTQGCAAAVAGASATTVLAQGRSFSEAETITLDDLCDFLDGIPDGKKACAATGPAALAEALGRLRERGDRP
ncbi:MAG: iron-sulfur cluster assembly scaffold protein [Deltaproteobacteria bacterium]|nr:iron-sulfur cluster assembly scaffold protein [Deltaproteobacteria bacterium]